MWPRIRRFERAHAVSLLALFRRSPNRFVLPLAYGREEVLLPPPVHHAYITPL